MFIGVSGNTASLETYWRHKLLHVPVSSAGDDSASLRPNAQRREMRAAILQKSLGSLAERLAAQVPV